jgi:hypothetical protein
MPKVGKTTVKGVELTWRTCLPSYMPDQSEQDMPMYGSLIADMLPVCDFLSTNLNLCREIETSQKDHSGARASFETTVVRK